MVAIRTPDEVVLAADSLGTLFGPGDSTREVAKVYQVGAVYFGALTYIGNAPNFMIKAIAEDRGVAMPSFFAYFGCAALVMLPLLALVAAVWL